MVSVIIPTYKNTELLIKNLHKNLPYLKDCEIIIVNDDPTTSLKKELKQFEKIKLIENKKNLGFGESINQGVKIAQGDYLLLLNNDVVLSNNNYQLTINHFRNNYSLFAVSFAQEEKNNQVVGKNRLFWHKGFYQHEAIKDNQPGENGWAEGGSCLIDKEKFRLLGGFDKIYAPFYWEDIDLSYRAKKRGWSIIFDPKIKVIHHHESTIGKYYDKKQIAIIAFRNQLIFTWKNRKTFQQKIENLCYLFLMIIKSLVKGNLIYINGLISALKTK